MLKSYEFIVIRDLYSEVEIEKEDRIEIEVKLIKKNLKTKWFCKDLTIISSCEEVYTDLGNIRKDYCKITVDGIGEKIIKMRYEDAKKLINSESSTKVGFK